MVQNKILFISIATNCIITSVFQVFFNFELLDEARSLLVRSKGWRKGRKGEEGKGGGGREERGRGGRDGLYLYN